jgi:hypothetical protein
MKFRTIRLYGRHFAHGLDADQAPGKVQFDFVRPVVKV